jgi:drug/metabolite transporter (DMT)-like permease
MNNEIKGTIFAILAAVISGVSIPLNKSFVVNIDPLVFTSIRLLLIGTIFLIISYFRHEKINKKINIKYLALIAIIGGAFAFLLFFDGLRLTTSGRAAFLQKTMPIYVVVLAFLFLKERITKKYLYSIFLMLIGTAVIYYSEIVPAQLWLNPSLGDLLVIGATILWALENVLSRKVMIKGESNFIVSFVRMFFGGIILFSIVLLLGKYDLLMSLNSQQVISISVSTIILFGYVLFWYWSLKFINVTKASSLLLLSPVISLLIGNGFLNEPVPFTQLIGSALILVGVYFVSKIKSEFQNI